MERFKVGVRIRPQIERNNEKFDVEAAIKLDDTVVALSNVGSGQVQAKRQAFTFDHIWDRDTGQEDIYEDGVCVLVSLHSKPEKGNEKWS